MATIKKGLLLVSVSAKVSKVSRIWLGDLCKPRKLHIFPPMLISKFMHSFKNWISGTFNGNELRQEIQTPPLLVLSGLSARTKVYPGTSKLPLLDEILESK